MQWGKEKLSSPAPGFHTSRECPISVIFCQDKNETYDWGISMENHSHRVAHASGGLLGATLERFLQMPIAVVLPVLWVMGMALLSLGVLTLYALGTLLASVVAGASI